MMTNAVYWHAIARGNMMALQRLIFTFRRLMLTAMGALWVGALVSGPAWSQQVPAPKLYGDITECAGGMLPLAAMAMGAAHLLGSMGALETALDQDRADAAGDINDDELGMLSGLLDISGCDNPVASGYDKAVELYAAAVRAQDALGDEPTADELQAAREAQSARDAYGGAVYRLVYSQQMRLADVDKAVEEYNILVGADGTYATLKTGYDDIVVSNLAGASPTDDELAAAYGMGAVGGYRAINGNDTANDNAIEIEDDSAYTDAFNESGALMFADTDDSDGGLASSNINTLGEIVAEYTKWKNYAEARQEVLDDAITEGNEDLEPLREHARRAAKARDHVMDELTRLTSVVRGQNRTLGTAIPIGTASITDERTLLSRFDRVNGDVESAAGAVRDAVRLLDGANKALSGSLSSADSYLSQLVSLREYEKEMADADLADAGSGAAQRFEDAVEAAEDNLDDARKLLRTHMNLTGDPDSPGSQLLSALLVATGKDGDDDGLALVDAVSDVHSVAMDAKGEVDALTKKLTDDDGNLIELLDQSDLDGVQEGVTENSGDIDELTERVGENGGDLDTAWKDFYGRERGVDAQHGDLSACDAPGIINVANCADARSRHNEEMLTDHGMKLEQKKEYIDNLAEEIGVDAVTGVGTTDNGMSRIDNNESRSMVNEVAIGMNSRMITTNAEAITTNAGAIMTNATSIMTERTERMAADMMLADRIDVNSMRLDTHEMMVGQNTMAITALDGRVGSNETAIQRNSGMIGELNESLETVRAGVAASMALAGMPAINGRGIAIGVGSFDGESAFAVGFQIQGEQASFQVGVTSAGGETGASAGVGFNF